MSFFCIHIFSLFLDTSIRTIDPPETWIVFSFVGDMILIFTHDSRIFPVWIFQSESKVGISRERDISLEVVLTIFCNFNSSACISSRFFIASASFLIFTPLNAAIHFIIRSLSAWRREGFLIAAFISSRVLGNQYSGVTSIFLAFASS
jgi:hypothetical protein